VVIELGHPPSARARHRGAHQPGRSRAQNHHIELAQIGRHRLLFRIAAERWLRCCLGRPAIKKKLLSAAFAVSPQ
jgi:hypothetical protein